MRRDLEHEAEKRKPVFPWDDAKRLPEDQAQQELRRKIDSTRPDRWLAGLARRRRDIAATAPDQRCVLPDRQRFADEIALHRVAALFGEEAELFLGFDPLGHDRHLQAVAKADPGANDRPRLRVAPEIHDKSAVDLDLVERERLQIAQRGIA